MARTGGFLSGPTGVHNTQKIRKHRLQRGVTRDMNSAAGTLKYRPHYTYEKNMQCM